MPALYENEKKTVLPYVLFTTGLFVGGVPFGYYVVLPIGLKFLVGYGGDIFNQQLRAGEYVCFVTLFLLAFGVVFEMPVVHGAAGLGAWSVRSVAAQAAPQYAVVVIAVGRHGAHPQPGPGQHAADDGSPATPLRVRHRPDEPRSEQATARREEALGLPMSPETRVVVLGVGNLLLTDEGVGPTTIAYLANGGVSAHVELVDGARRARADERVRRAAHWWWSTPSGGAEPGAIYRFHPDRCPRRAYRPHPPDQFLDAWTMARSWVRTRTSSSGSNPRHEHPHVGLTPRRHACRISKRSCWRNSPGWAWRPASAGLA